MAESQTKKKRSVRKTEERDLARSYYMTGKLNDAQIVAKVKCSVNTFRAWKEEGNWEALRAANTVTRPQEVNRLLLQISKINDMVDSSPDGIPDPKQTDAISKITAAIEKLDKKDSLPTVVHICQDLCDYISNYDDEESRRLIDWVDRYVQHKAAITR